MRSVVLDPESPQQGGALSSIHEAPAHPPPVEHTPSTEDPWFSRSESPAMGAPGQHHQQHGQHQQTPDMTIGGGRLGGGLDDYDEENEPPLLEELGVRFDHIYEKTQSVMLPYKKLSEHLLDDADLAGPLMFCLALGVFMFVSGKFQAFGYIYGFALFGCFIMHSLLNLLQQNDRDISFWITCSVLGYCLLPIIFLAALSVVLSLKGTFGLLLAVVAIFWSTFSASRLFDAKLQSPEQYYLVSYPTALLYFCFALITVF